MAKAGGASKHLPHGQGACPHAQINDWSGPIRPRVTRIRRAGLASRESDSGLFSLAKVNAGEELWTICALSVDGLRGRLRRFRKSHHLIRAGSGAPRGIAVGSGASIACRPAACGNHRIV